MRTCIPLVASDHNINVTEIVRLKKYADLLTDFARRWCVQANIVPVITVSSVPPNINSYIQKIGLKSSILSLQKALHFFCKKVPSVRGFMT